MQEKLQRKDMSFEDFCVSIKTNIRHRLSGVEVKLIDVTKNNNRKLKGILIKDIDNNIAPTIYLENHYKKYVQSDISLDDVIDDIISEFERNNISDMGISEDIKDWRYVRRNVYYKLINYEKNKELLQSVPFVRFLDLAIVFFIIVDLDTISHALPTITITKDLLELWGIRKRELFEAANHNTPKYFSYEIAGLTDLIKKLCPDFEPVPLGDMNLPIYVLSNKENIFGASTILYQGLLQELSDVFRSDIFVVPCSVNEVLLMPKDEAVSPFGIKRCICEVNKEVVSPEEFLSDNLYIYSREKKEISIYMDRISIYKEEDDL